MIVVILRGSRDVCVSPFSTNIKALKIRIYNDGAEKTLALNGLVIIRLLSQG